MNFNSFLLIILIIQNIFYMDYMSSPFTSVTEHKSGIEEINYFLDQINANVGNIADKLDDK